MRDILVIAGAVLVAGAVYLARCWFYPYGPCRSCAGRRGRNAGSTRRAWGRCRKCGGMGERVRLGARLLGREK